MANYYSGRGKGEVKLRDFAHAARTLLFTNASSQDTRELVGRALDLDPNNPLACQVLDRVIG